MWTSSIHLLNPAKNIHRKGSSMWRSPPMRQTSTTLAPTRERRLAKKELLRIMACADSYARRFILEEAHARRLGQSRSVCTDFTLTCLNRHWQALSKDWSLYFCASVLGDFTSLSHQGRVLVYSKFEDGLISSFCSRFGPQKINCQKPVFSSCNFLLLSIVTPLSPFQLHLLVFSGNITIIIRPSGKKMDNILGINSFRW